MTHILFISDNFYPESTAAANRLYDHAREWVKNGYKVSIITCAPNFPLGKVFKGYKNKWRQVEYIDGIKVIRIKSYMAANTGFLKRILDFTSFALHAIIQGFFVKKPDIIIGTSPQPFTIFSAWILSKVKRTTFVFELRDIWPDSVLAVDAMKKKNWLLDFFGWSMKKMYQYADIIVSVTDSFKTILVETENIDPSKIIVCKNGVDLEVISITENSEKLKIKYGLKNKYLVGYVGTIGMAHNVAMIIEAAKKIF